MYETTNKTLLTGIKAWFKDYVKEFYSGDPDVQENIHLKEMHTIRVCEAILEIGNSLGLSEQDISLAELSALLHDIGRFEQYKKYGTFSDFRSENHAELGAKVIRDSEILKDMEPDISEMIIRLVRFHNCAVLPKGEDDRFIFFLKLLRDADKIDIWKVVTEYYEKSGQKRNPSIELDLSNNPEITEPVCQALMNRHVVNMSKLKTLNDFKMLQIGWVYDLNFPRTFEMVRENRFLERIRASMPLDSAEINSIYTRVHAYLDSQL